jgi:hypothetical protein
VPRVGISFCFYKAHKTGKNLRHFSVRKKEKKIFESLNLFPSFMHFLKSKLVYSWLPFNLTLLKFPSFLKNSQISQNPLKIPHFSQNSPKIYRFSKIFLKTLQNFSLFSIFPKTSQNLKLINKTQ